MAWRWRTLFHLIDHGETFSAPLPCERIDIPEGHDGRPADTDDVPHAVADLLAHALPFVATGDSHVIPAVEDPEVHLGDARLWRFLLKLKEGSAPASGFPLGSATRAVEPLQAHAVSIEGTFEFACKVSETVETIRGVPGLLDHLLAERRRLEGYAGRAAAAEARLEDIDLASGE